MITNPRKEKVGNKTNYELCKNIQHQLIIEPLGIIVDYHRKLVTLEKRIYSSVRRRGKNVDSSSMSNPLRRRGKKITTRRREGIGVVVEKNEEIRRTFNKNSCDLLIAITHTEIMCALYKTNKQFNKKTKIMKAKRSMSR